MTTATLGVTVREHQLRIAKSEAAEALGRVMQDSAIQARKRLRFGPGRTCEQIARLLDRAIVQAESIGLSPKDLILSAANVVPAEDIIRVRRKAHGLSDWISSPTSDVTVILRPEGADGETGLQETREETPVTAPDPEVIRPETKAEEIIRNALRGVMDPDLGVNIVDFGFVRRVRLRDPGFATITMTLTSPACPLVKVMTDQMRAVLSAMDVDFAVEWVPAWRPEEITQAGREELELIGFTPF